MQTKAGAIKAKNTVLAKYGAGYYAKIGAMPHPRGGFKGRPDLAKIAGARGGTISRRGKAIPTPENDILIPIRHKRRWWEIWK